MTSASNWGLVEVVIQHLLMWLALGRNAALFSLFGGVLWAESESIFAYLDGIYVVIGSINVPVAMETVRYGSALSFCFLVACAPSSTPLLPALGLRRRAQRPDRSRPPTRSPGHLAQPRRAS